MKQNCIALVFTGLAGLFTAQSSFGQGCIVARSNGEVGGPDSQGGYLAPGEFNFSIGYRHQFSFRHFVGPTEQTYRIEQGTQIMNKINLQNFAVTYQISPRYSVTADVPLLLASRRAHNSPVTNTTQGIGDMSFLAQGWVWNPKENTKGNLQFGVGVSFPTGKDNIYNIVDRFDGKGPVSSLADYSIQPGTGGYGLIFQWAAFKNVSNSQLYFNGSYLATPQNVNSVQRSSNVNPVTLTQLNSISDQYLLEGGIAHPISRVKGLTITFGPRMEGVPANDLIGDSLGFRRPGFAISLEPGFQYARQGNVFTFSVAKAVYRDRTRSAPDVITGGHGDAAFADWVWLASYSFRYSPFHHAALPDHTMADHKTSATGSK